MHDLTVTVYDRPDCVQCRMVERRLTKEGIPYQVKALADHPDVVQSLKEAGFQSAPGVTLTDNGKVAVQFGGNNPKHLDQLVHAYAALLADI